ncbi:hypothetical protein FWD20_02095 [Candidatus Saccharibacteria bacterium]|nr:hypothetical protein [Candidatus Saccharibacteria bacterium]
MEGKKPDRTICQEVGCPFVGKCDKNSTIVKSGGCGTELLRARANLRDRVYQLSHPLFSWALKVGMRAARLEAAKAKLAKVTGIFDGMKFINVKGVE